MISARAIMCRSDVMPPGCSTYRYPAIAPAAMIASIVAATTLRHSTRFATSFAALSFSIATLSTGVPADRITSPFSMLIRSGATAARAARRACSVFAVSSWSVDTISGRTISAVNSASSALKFVSIDESTLSFADVTLVSSSDTLSSCVRTRRPSDITNCQRSFSSARAVSMLRGESWSDARASRLRATSVACVRICVVCEVALSYWTTCVVRTLGSNTSAGRTAFAASSRRCCVRKPLSNETLRGDFTVREATSLTWILNWRGKIGNSATSSTAASAVPNAAVVTSEMGRGLPRLSMVHLRPMIAGGRPGQAAAARRSTAAMGAMARS